MKHEALLQQAILHFQKGNHASALADAQRFLQREPDHLGARHLAAFSAQAAGERQLAEKLLCGLVESLSQPAASPTHPSQVAELWLRLAAVRLERENFIEAEAAARQALRLIPESAQAWNMLGGILETSLKLTLRTQDQLLNPLTSDQQATLREAEHAFRHALALSPQQAQAQGNLAIVLHHLRRFPEARVAYEQALILQPQHISLRHNLAQLLLISGQPQAAQRLFTELLDEASQSDTQAYPVSADLHFALGQCALQRGNPAEAWPHFHFWLSNRPNSNTQENHIVQLANILFFFGQYTEAETLYRTRLEECPDDSESACALAELEALSQRLIAARERYRKLLTRIPDHALALQGLSSLHARLAEWEAVDDLATRAATLPLAPFSRRRKRDGDRLFDLGYHPTMTRETMLERFRQWAGTLPVPPPVPSPAPTASTSTSNRRLRVGYVSADFKNHPCLCFVLPLLAHHDRERFELFAYSGVVVPDAHTPLFQPCFDHWIEAWRLDDDELAQRIRHDGIDILVDLSGHTAGHRLEVFARRAAPVQITWIGFGNTTGVPAMDFFLGDSSLTPPETSDKTQPWLTEHVWRMEGPSCTYLPPADTPDINSLPALSNGFITFGSLSRTQRFNPRLFRVWAEIMAALPSARLRLDQKCFLDPATAQHFRTLMTKHGLPPERMDLVCSRPHWQGYHAIDIALDPFPHNAGTTNFEALWMGVPVVSLRDRIPMGRFGAYALDPVGLSDWAVSDEASYIQRALKAATDLDTLSALRQTLRSRLQASPLMDHAGFARRLEQSYRQMRESAPLDTHSCP